MNKLKVLFFLLLAITMSFKVPSANAAPCVLVDPIQGDINITCTSARLNVSGNGMRNLPHPNDVTLGTMLRIDWIQPFSGNTNVQSWDAGLQRTHFWTRENGVWTNTPENAILQEIGAAPQAALKTQIMPNGERGWAIYRLYDLMAWNGGN